ncbi:O-acetyl-ADP-ribose deacetylase MACROD2 [Liparis tanakae]|uniref:O-acetyl-ADP-ribose deacetylase MACROD2 n=1 Tax=Liparis tanakae TaxID=230148 RepID=A0A4Z2IAC6_9TELE|nr:O-acetyl-ADP-ribose deacetylase MACROD2 [Liparis tanakae]
MRLISTSCSSSEMAMLSLPLQRSLCGEARCALSRLLLQSLRGPQTQEHATFKEGFEKVNAQACRMVELQLSRQTGSIKVKWKSCSQLHPSSRCQCVASAVSPATNIIPAAVKAVDTRDVPITRVIFCVFLETDYAIYKKKMSDIFPDNDMELTEEQLKGGKEELGDEDKGDDDVNSENEGPSQEKDKDENEHQDKDEDIGVDTKEEKDEDKAKEEQPAAKAEDDDTAKSAVEMEEWQLMQLDTCVSWLGSKVQGLFRRSRPVHHATVWGSNEQKKVCWGTDTVGHRHLHTTIDLYSFTEERRI